MLTIFLPWFPILLGWILVASYHDTSRYDNSVIHTFDTMEMCMSRCRTICSQHHSEDLMMPRWHCPAQEDEHVVFQEGTEEDIIGILLIVIPAIVFCGMLFLFICISCVQRFFRNDM